MNAECAAVVFASCSSNSRCKVARIVVSSASAAVAFDSASCALCSNSGLVNSNMTSPGSTFVPGQIKIFSTLPSVFAGIQRMSSGTSVPRPRTCRTIGPRLTVSIQTVERSTLGTAGFKREMPIVIRINPSADAAMIMTRRLRFFAATPARGTSIDERVGVNPAGRTIVPSFDCRCGITVESKPTESPTKVDYGIGSAHQRHSRGDHYQREQNRFADEIRPRLVLQVLPTG